MIITAKILLGLALKIVAIHGSDMNVKKLVVVAERKNTANEFKISLANYLFTKSNNFLYMIRNNFDQ